MRFGALLGFRGGEEALRDGVIPAVSLAAHAGHPAERPSGRTEVIASAWTLPRSE